MTAPPDLPDPNATRPPFGSWARTYAATMVLAVVVMLLLWLLSTFNVPLGSTR